MGSRLTPLIKPEKIGLKGVEGKVLAVDALNAVYQFLALVRGGRGELLSNSRGLVTSHLVGLATRFSRLAYELNCRFIFVFDGPPHPLKRGEIARRRELRERALEEYRRLIEVGEYEKAFSKAIASASVDEWIIESSKRLIRLMGFPIVEAPYDAEAQAALLVSKGLAWAVASQDWDSLLYGAPRLVRYVTLTGFEWLPSKQAARRLEPELVELGKLLSSLSLTREQLIEVAVLSGTDYNKGVRGIGPKKALRLIKLYGGLDRLPASIREKLPANYKEILDLFLNPPVREDIEVCFTEPLSDKLYGFLVDENDFSPERAKLVIERLEKAWKKTRFAQSTLESFL